jgi:hypothetical protein
MEPIPFPAAVDIQKERFQTSGAATPKSERGYPLHYGFMDEHPTGRQT